MLSNPFYFSTFSAVTEIIVTVIVLFVIIDNMRGNPLKWKLLFATLAFELFVNVAYMVNRTIVVSTNHPAPFSHWVGLLGAFHGILSLVMFIGLIVLVILAFRASRRGEAFFQRHKVLASVFIVLWLISIVSGEILYFAVWQPLQLL